MALTPEQKAANKLAAKVRDAAYRARLKEYRAVYDAAVAPYSFDSACPAPEVLAYIEAGTRFQQALDARDAAAAALILRIKTLDEELKNVYASPVPYTEERREAAALVRRLAAEKTKEVNAAYPDIADVSSAVEWEGLVKKQPVGGVCA